MASSRAWLHRYQRPEPIRSRGAFHVVSAERGRDGAPCVVLVPGHRAAAGAAAAAFEEIERVHRLLGHPRIPPVTARGTADGTPYLELGCDAFIDGVDVHDLLGDAEEKMPLAFADGFITSLREALESAHAVTDPRTKQPVCLGRLSRANVLFSRRGEHHLVGFGRNFPVEKEGGQPDAWTTAFQAPEVSIGGAPSPVGDYIALLLFLRAMLPLVDPGPVLGRLIGGEVRPGDEELLECLKWANLHLIGSPPQRRRSVEEAERVADRIRELCGAWPDPAGFVAHVRRPLEGRRSRHMDQPGGGPVVTLGLETTWAVGEDGVRHAVGHAHSRILSALAELHRRAPGAALTSQELLAAGWPGERMAPEAGANRVYVVLAQLRRMGMRHLIERCKGGYRFAPDAAVHLSS